LYAKAVEKYKAAIKIKPNDHLVLYNWGNTLFEQAKMKSGSERGQLLAEAVDKFEAALDIKPDDFATLSNCAAALVERARGKSGAEEDTLLDQAVEKCKAALDVKPNDSDCVNALAATLFAQARKKSGEQRQRLLAEAKEKLYVVESASPGSSAYNLACLGALAGEEAECREWLEKSQKAGALPSREHLANDPDLENVREKAWFGDFLEGIQDIASPH